MVADVDGMLEHGQPLLTDEVQRKHRLELGAISFAQPDEAELAGVAQEDHAAGHRDDFAGLDVRAQGDGVVRTDDVAERVRAFDGDRIGILTGGDQFVAFLAADAQLLREILPLVSTPLIGHEQPP